MPAGMGVIWMFAAMSSSGSIGGASPLTTGHLLREMTDLKRLAEFPAPAYKTVQFSSCHHAMEPVLLRPNQLQLRQQPIDGLQGRP